MTSISASRQCCAFSSTAAASAPRGGSSSTETTNFFPSFFAKELFWSTGMGLGASRGRTARWTPDTTAREGVDHPHRADQGLDVRGRRAAAAADDAHARARGIACA